MRMRRIDWGWSGPWVALVTLSRKARCPLVPRPVTSALPNVCFCEARPTFVLAKVGKTVCPIGWPAAATPRQVPGSDAVLGVRADRTSLS